MKPSDIDDTMLEAFRQAIFKRVDMWDTEKELEDLLGLDVSADNLCAAALECDAPSHAFNLTKEQMIGYLDIGGLLPLEDHDFGDGLPEMGSEDTHADNGPSYSGYAGE